VFTYQVFEAWQLMHVMNFFIWRWIKLFVFVFVFVKTDFSGLWLVTPSKSTGAVIVRCGLLNQWKDDNAPMPTPTPSPLPSSSCARNCDVIHDIYLKLSILIHVAPELCLQRLWVTCLSQSHAATFHCNPPITSCVVALSSQWTSILHSFHRQYLFVNYKTKCQGTSLIFTRVCKSTLFQNNACWNAEIAHRHTADSGLNCNGLMCCMCSSGMCDRALKNGHKFKNLNKFFCLNIFATASFWQNNTLQVEHWSLDC
jgi:hypothetical protein